jgi:protoheme IX farnesyltransferase
MGYKMFKLYYQLTKPGIIYGNAITAIAGFFLASKGHINFLLLIAMLMGLSLIIGSSCVFNNVYDADIDAKMERTKNRAMVTGTISRSKAIIYASALGLLGCLVLILHTNPLTLVVALVGVIFYLILYTPLKRKTVYGTIIGAVAGATPPVVGYVAVTNNFDTAALLLFFILVFWQMPHFYAIAIRRLDEYKAAGIPVLPAKEGIHNTKIKMLAYIVAFILATSALTYFKYTGYIYLAVMLVLGLYWFGSGIKGFHSADDKVWAKKMFLSSLIILTIFSVVVSFGVRLP